MRVTTRADRNELKEESEERFRARVSAPPVEGAANQAVIELLSRKLNVPKSKISLVSGQTSRDKIFEIET